jgi:acetolactate decarboxylase
MKRAVSDRGRWARTALLVIVCGALIALLTGCVPVPAPARQVTQISTYPALQIGLYDGDVTYAELARMGDTGIGTFDGMDGEMIALDGRFYQARADGTVHQAEGSLETPFATVTFFKPDQRLQTPGPLGSYDELKAYLSEVAPPENRPCAIRVDGRFPTLKIRSIPPQSEPYPPLTDVIAQQTVWELKDLRGTLIGYWFPEYLSALNAPGYHLHFISDDRQVAGHVLEVSVDGAAVAIEPFDRVALQIPESAAYGEADFSAP